MTPCLRVRPTLVDEENSLIHSALVAVVLIVATTRAVAYVEMSTCRPTITLTSSRILLRCFTLFRVPSNVHEVAYCTPEFLHFKANSATRSSDALTLPASISSRGASTTTYTRKG